MLKLGILASTRGTDMQAIIDAIESGLLDARISCVIANRKEAYALTRAKEHGLEAIFIDPKKSKPEDFDTQVASELEKRGVDLIVLIGYNKFLSEGFVKKFPNRIMNIHPSLLPSFPGWDKSVHSAVLDYGAKITGCTLHFVDESKDAGPIILQRAVEVRETDDEETLKERVQAAEKEVLLEGIGLFASRRLHVLGRKVTILSSSEGEHA